MKSENSRIRLALLERLGDQGLGIDLEANIRRLELHRAPVDREFGRSGDQTGFESGNRLERLVFGEAAERNILDVDVASDTVTARDLVVAEDHHREGGDGERHGDGDSDDPVASAHSDGGLRVVQDAMVLLFCNKTAYRGVCAPIVGGDGSRTLRNHEVAPIGPLIVALRLPVGHLERGRGQILIGDLAQQMGNDVQACPFA